MRVGLPNSLYKYPSLQHYLNVCYKDCARMHCAMFNLAFRAGAVFKINIEVAVR